MADCYSTRICVVCGNPFQILLKSNGEPRANSPKTCSVKCYDYTYRIKKNPNQKPRDYLGIEAIKPRGDLCGVDGCDKKVKTKGYCVNHYQRMRLNGTLEPKRKTIMVSKDCEWCGKKMNLTENMAAKTFCCSLSCSSNLKARKRGLRVVSADTFTCLNCSKEFTRETRSLHNGEAKYCCTECFSAHREALRSIKQDINRQLAETARLVKFECTALKRIKRNIEKHFATIECKHCGTVVSKKERIAYWYCSVDCHKSAKKAKPITEAERASRRAAKSRRRAMIRNCSNLERFDPFEIFERDGWRCKCCGIKTPKKLRGTIKDNTPELDHIIPLSKGGDHSRQNTQLLCRKCNIDKSDGDAKDQLLLFG